MNLDKKIWQLFALVVMALIWGTSFILMKKGLQSYSNYQVAAFRIFISFVIVLPFLIKSVKKITRQNLLPLILVGFIGNLIPALLFTTAQTHINSSVAGMLNALTPIFTLVIGVLLFKTKTRFINIIGLIIGLIGAAGLAVEDFSTFFEGTNWFGIFAIIATLCYGFNVNIVKEKLHGLNAVEITSLAFLFTGPVAGVFLFFTDFSKVSSTDNYMINTLYIFLLALFSSVLAVLIMNKLIKHTTAVFASTVTYIIPIFAIIWGAIDGERFKVYDFLWIIIILVGVYLVNKKSKV